MIGYFIYLALGALYALIYFFGKKAKPSFAEIVLCVTCGPLLVILYTLSSPFWFPGWVMSKKSGKSGVVYDDLGSEF